MQVLFKDVCLAASENLYGCSCQGVFGVVGCLAAAIVTGLFFIVKGIV